MVMDWEHEPKLKAIHRAAELHRMAVARQQAELERLVADARAAGFSWEHIADALGVARQTAWERFRESGDS